MTATLDLSAALADQRQMAGDLVGAIALYDEIVEQHPGYWPAHANRGLALAVLNDHPAARAGFRRALVLEPSAAPALRNLADSLKRDAADRARVVARALTAVSPQSAESWICLGGVELDSDRRAPAEHALRRALALDPGSYAEALTALALSNTTENRAWLHRALAAGWSTPSLLALARLAGLEGDRAAAGRHIRRAIALEPANGECLVELSAVVDSFLEPEALYRWGRRAVLRVPESAAALNNLGTAALGLGYLADAERCFARAIDVRPDFPEAHFNRATPLFLLGRTEEAWSEYEWRWRIERFEKPPSASPCWNGEALAGRRLLVHEEQGLGDSLQFVRYLPLLLETGADVAFQCDPRLVRILRESFPSLDVVAKPVVPRHDVRAPLMSLPPLLGRANGPPPSPPYLAGPTAPRRDAGGRRRVGLVWAGNPAHPRDRDRTIPLERLRPWFALPDLAWFSMQVGPARSRIQDLGLGTTVADLGVGFSDLRDAADALADVDLLISVDTAACHLAGALGLPTWALVTWVPDWRWGMRGDTTPWYPSMRLFRQPARSDWQPVVDEVGRALMRWRTSP